MYACPSAEEAEGLEAAEALVDWRPGDMVWVCVKLHKRVPVK